MAKRQNFIVGSANPNTQSRTVPQLEQAWNKFEVLKSGELDGVFNAVSDYSNDSSNEIANAIASITGSEPTGATQTELAGALQQMRSEIETTSLTFKGYISANQPSAGTYDFKVGDIWIQSATLPTVFPVAIAGIWDGTQWASTTDTYTQQDFDFFRNINDNEGYYWFGGEWTVMSTDMDTSYFQLNAQGKWTIKNIVTTDTAQTIPADKEFTGHVETPTPLASSYDNTVATTKWVKDNVVGELSLENVANCLTNVPQDIKLELSSGTLTLKAGSKVYVPNGAGVFDSVTTTSDLTDNSTGTQQALVYYSPSMNRLIIRYASKSVSGNTRSLTTTYMAWYDTANNVINDYPDNTSTPRTTMSLPVALVTLGASGVESIDQVFNGFGYIGSTVFALPSVSGLIPNGRNADGTLKNSTWTTTNVVTRTFASSDNGVYTIGFEGNGYSRIGTSYYRYDESANIQWNGNAGWSATLLGYIKLTNGVIDNSPVRTTFHAFDYNDIVNIIYPVGSLYFGTQTTCPIQLLYPNTGWTKIATKIITDITGIKGSIGTSSASDNGKYFVAQTTSFSQQTAPAAGGYHMNVTNNQTITGASVTNSSITVNVWRRDY